MINNNVFAGSTLSKVLCAVGFTLFSFFYLHYMQFGLLSLEQHVLSGGTTHYERNIGTTIIMCVLWALNLFVSKLTRLKGNCYSLVYVPSMCLLLMLTSATVTTDNEVCASLSSICFAVIICALFVLFAIFAHNKKYLTSDIAWRHQPMSMLWKNLSILLVLIFVVCIGGNTDKALHNRLYIESLLIDKKYDKAVEYSKRLDIDDKNITMLRAYALSKCKKMGDLLFEGSVYGKSEALLPNGKSIKTLILSDAEIFKMLAKRKKGHYSTMRYLKFLKDNGVAFKSVTDYLLCGYLLNKNLDSFVRELQHKYNVQSSTLPKHYKEALILYTHLRANPEFVYHDAVLEADYSDMQKLAVENKYTRHKEAYVKEAIVNTY